MAFPQPDPAPEWLLFGLAAPDMLPFPRYVSRRRRTKAMKSKITNDILESYLRCKYKAHPMRIITRVFFFLMGWASPFAHAQPPTPEKPKSPEVVTLPDTPAGGQLKAFLEAINSGERETNRRFVSEHFLSPPGRALPVGEMADMHVRLFGETGGLAASQVMKSSAHDIEVILRAKRTGVMELRLSLNVEATPPPQDRKRVVPSAPPDRAARRIAAPAKADRR